jgi:hypothetical protein
MKYRGKYRLRTPIDKSTNTFPREYNGQLAENDVYIDCQNGVQVSHYGHGVLEAYIPSLQSGRTMIKFIYRDLINKNNTETKINTYEVSKKGEIISVTKETISIIDKELYKQDINKSDLFINITESDEEVIFKFHSKYMEQLEPYLKPKTNGADRSPFSSKNLPKSKYEIPDEDLVTYKEIIENIPKNQLIAIVHTTNNFLKSLVTKKNTWENIKADMSLKGLKGKDYIHSIGKWDDYIKYLKRNLEL